ncbi:substrate-binding domain-containing protein [Mesonia sp. K7]|uniref:substrate-binding domain-containing protein n=1 Tax=Mesonia sp. K7 TaxID=2218606 RepID=UPI000DAA0477|nr:substrate-binding domain-containing protein [Mesonia sp. K7]PZD79193.1 ABC transporter substrate-binding protein [Mesonia sp. K7]
MKKIKVGGVPEHFNYPWHLALADQLFQQQHIEVTWKDYYGGTGEISRALHAKEVDVALVLTESIIKEIEDGAPFKIIQEYIATPLLWGIHVAANSSYQDIDDIEKTTSAISRYGSGSHLMTIINAENQDWDTDDVKFKVVKDLKGALQALPKDEAQYFMWEHFTTKPYVDKGIFRRIANCPTPWPCFVIVAHQDFIDENSKEIKQMLSVINKLTKDFKTIPSISKKLAAAYQQKEKDIKEWLKITEWSQKQIGEQEVRNAQEQLFELGLIQQISDFNKICEKI